jgi:aspartyl-tRNA(Asn)/glutamyl-tRNA(Gln) amidotransferase subunit A
MNTKINLENLTIEKAHDSLKSGEYTVTELVNFYLEVIKEKNEEINAYREVYSDVLDQALIAQEMFKNGTATLMTGIPLALKDNMLVDGHIASASSLMLENYKATYDAGIIKQLKKQGAVFLGRTNMDEFAMGSSTENSAFGNTKNPLDITRVPGGSSGGSVAAVAMNGALVSLGSDTGGSIRQPASFCGLVGLKPSYGTVSRFGIISMGSSLDQVGPFGKTVRDAEILFNAINEYDEKDGTSIKKENRLQSLPLKKKIGVPRSFLCGDGTDPEIMKNFEESCKKLEDAGYEIVDVSLPLIKYSLAVYYIIAPAEVSSNLARYDGIRYGLHEDGKNLYEVYTKTRGKGFGKEVRRRILLGTYILSHGYYDAYYNTAIKVRDAIKDELTNIFLEVDAIVTPTSPMMPFKFGEKSADPISMYLADLFSVPANIAGIPAMSIPSGKNAEGLPYGFHIMAPFLREDILFTIGKDFEKQV